VGIRFSNDGVPNRGIRLIEGERRRRIQRLEALVKLVPEDGLVLLMVLHLEPDLWRRP